MYRPIPNISFTVADLAERLSAPFEGDGQRRVEGLCAFDSIRENGIAFYSGGSPLRDLQESHIQSLGAVLVKPKAHIPKEVKPAIIRVPQPLEAMLRLVPCFFESARPQASIHPSACISPSASLGKNVHVGPFCVIGDHVQIDDDVVLFPHVVLYEGVRIGKGSVLHARVTVREFCSIGSGSVLQPGAVLGADGFGYVPSPHGLMPVPQIGQVILADQVDVGANACIDRATFGKTQIGRGTKIDNLVQIGHNTQVGEQSIFCGQVGIAGSTKIGSQVVLGGMCGVADHIHIGDKIRVAAKAAVLRDLSDSGDYAGIPAIPKRAWTREVLRYSKKFSKD